MVSTKHCRWGRCNSDSRYPDKMYNSISEAIARNRTLHGLLIEIKKTWTRRHICCQNMRQIMVQLLSLLCLCRGTAANLIRTSFIRKQTKDFNPGQLAFQVLLVFDDVYQQQSHCTLKCCCAQIPSKKKTNLVKSQKIQSLIRRIILLCKLSGTAVTCLLKRSRRRNTVGETYQ